MSPGAGPAGGQARSHAGRDLRGRPIPEQAAFAAALLDPAAPCPAGLGVWNGSDPAARLAVYRNNVASSLVDALAETFPVSLALVGEAFFRAMARVFVFAEPPRSPVLAIYGEGFPAFVAGFEPARAVPYLADVARLEWLRMRACHAADAQPLDPAQLAAALADPDSLPLLRLDTHPSLAVLASPYAVVSLWAAHQDVLELAAVDPSRGERALILREGLDVQVIGLPPGADLFVCALAAGASFGDAAAQGAAASPGFDLVATLAVLIRHGAFTAAHLPLRSV